MTQAGALVIATTSFPIRADGSEAAGSFVADLAMELGKHIPIRVVAPGPESIREIWQPGVEVFRYSSPSKPLSTLNPWRLQDLWSIRKVFSGGHAAMQRAFAAGPVRHVLALWALPSAHWASTISRETGTPYSVWTLGSDIWTLGRIPLIRGWLHRVLRDAKYCYSDGLKLAEDTRRIAKRDTMFLPSTRLIDGSHVVSRNRHPPYSLLFLGRWHRNKGVDLLMEALHLLGDDDWDRIAEINVCGGGPLEDQVRNDVQSLCGRGLPVKALGYLDKRNAEGAIIQADYVLIPSRIESIPLIYSDAVKLRCPVVCSPVGDLPQLVAGVHPTGVVAGDISAIGFATAIREALETDRSRFDAGLALAAKRFDLHSVAQTLIENFHA